MKSKKRFLLAVFFILIIVIAYNYPKLNIISGYASKNMASSVFVAERSAGSIEENDNNVPLIKLADVEMRENTASATVFGLMERRTICRDGLGCVLINNNYDPKKNILRPNRNTVDSLAYYPFENRVTDNVFFDNVDYDLLEKAVDGAFANAEVQKTRTVLVAYKNKLLTERYADGFTPETPILGWSMTKSVLATLYGILEYQGRLNMNYRPFKELALVDSTGTDPREIITLDDLLRMSSGLAWNEDYTQISDVTKMLFLDEDMTQAQQETDFNPKDHGKVWNYSSGTSNLLSGILRKQFKNHQEYLDFPYSALIDKIGMYSMLVETDMAGNFVGSSYGWASTRDWAKFGLLYLNKGNWNGERLFDSQWVDYVTRPTPLSNGTYGAHFWLNANGKYPDVPKDLYSANGYQGQYVFIVPSKDLVVVRTGLAESPDFDVNGFLKEVLAAID
ncbi:serine hydrolase domain-containing protein [Maribacter algicola]|uniref:Serine hydrolase domain-containing protein n=1 Tax=Meishania litoralis TaxID=3434685 RepID=A0ACC7LJU3_9FLAO